MPDRVEDIEVGSLCVFNGADGNPLCDVDGTRRPGNVRSEKGDTCIVLKKDGHFYVILKGGITCIVVNHRIDPVTRYGEQE